MSGTRSALVVASDRYLDPGLRRLRAPARDAAALARVLGDPAIGGFGVRVVANQPEHVLRREIAAFFADRLGDDLLLAHFSCHGVKDDSGQLYFATADTELANLDATAVPADYVNRHMTRTRSRRVVLLLDCCYSGAFARGMLARADERIDLAERFEGRGRIVLTASSAMEYAFEEAELSRDGARPSVFTHALVRGMETGEADRDGDGRIAVDELYEYVFEQVRRTTPNQTPGRWNFDVQGDLLIARTPRVRAAPLPPELRQAVEHPLAGARLGAVGELELLVRGSHPGLALSARLALLRLRADDSQQVSASAAAVLAKAPKGWNRATAAAAPASHLPLPAPVPRRSADPPQPVDPQAAGAPDRHEAPRRRPSRRGWPLVAVLAGLAAIVAILVASRLDTAQHLSVGEAFAATAPWRLQVEGSQCSVTVTSPGGASRQGYGTNYVVQMRETGRFLLEELSSGCVAVRRPGMGKWARLPFQAGSGGSGTSGGDSLPFHAGTGFEVTVANDQCHTVVHDSGDGSVVTQFDGSDQVPSGGDFFLTLDPAPNCAVRVTPG